jgi:hypothetical protein
MQQHTKAHYNRAWLHHMGTKHGLYCSSAASSSTPID